MQQHRRMVWKMPLSYSSICRGRMKSHFKLSSSLKANFSAHVPLIIHVDGKILPALCGGPEKEDRVAIVVSGKEGENFSRLGRHLWYLSPFRCCTCGIEMSHGSTFTGNIGTARIRSSINQMHCNTEYEHQDS